jgi:genome maintenance exonuclease 1
MANFNIDLVEFAKIKRVTIDGTRYYVGEGESMAIPYPSVTTVLSADKKKKEAIKQWRKRVGEKEATKISTRAANRGTAAHTMIENYVQGIVNENIMPLHLSLFNQLKNVADERINNIRCIEGQMYSHYLRCAGTVDMIAEFDGVLSVIDWKTSTRAKRRSNITNYFMQESAYAVMFEELTDLPVSQLVTVVATEDGEPQVFVEKRDEWINKFIDLRNLFEAENQIGTMELSSSK